ncbi:MAG: hypothetical protein IT384_32525 [Deltaproteobacteria bacterium]|nr:hypothetical protein [Deltaproteobacteria bacterium]
MRLAGQARAKRAKTGLSIAALLITAGCGASGDYDPGVRPEDFQSRVDHRLFPLPVGARWVYSGTTAQGLERIEVEVLPETKTVAWGAVATVVKDTAFMDGEKVEETWDWYAQHRDGSVWYLGEDTAEYENGMIVNHAGAWEAGVDGALPGIVMMSTPEVGAKYRQEYYQGEAEDYGEIVALDAGATVPGGSWTACVKTHDTSAIDAALDELKTYCPGVGLTLVEEGTVRVELVRYSGL